ncbi:hypothetical protein FJ365_02960 [Candidatus Dependentiae bacterium]|nr:hypothetical protein [Candidatus Dependentiae bacterium]
MAMLSLKKIQIRYWVAMGLIVAVLLGALNAMEPTVRINDSSPETVGSASSEDLPDIIPSPEAAHSTQTRFAAPAEYRDLILLLDPLQEEVDSIGFLSMHLALGIVETAAPIITSTHIVRNFLMNSHAQKIGMVGLLKSGWHFFKHKNAHLMLLLPDAYLRRIASDARSLADALSICGFSTAHLNQVLPKDWPLVLSSTTRKTSTSCINALKDMLIKKAEAPSLHWNIYLAGHGVAASRRRDATLTLLPETAQIAGLNFMEFDQLMSFLNGKTDDDIQASFLAYTTCFGGGTNQQFINYLLDKIDTSFIVAGQGVNDTSVWIEPNNIAFTDRLGWHTTGKLSFSQFFQCLHGFHTGATFMIDPFKAILQPVYGNLSISNQPSIRLPHLGMFQLVNVDQQVKNLSNVQVRTHELEGTPIEIDSAKTTFIVVPSHHVGTTIRIKNFTDIEYPAFIFPTNEPGETVDRTLFHYFKRIEVNASDDTEEMIQHFLCSLIAGNRSTLPITILVQSVSFIKSDRLETTLENLIINIDRRKSLENTDINIAYQYNGEVYNAAISYKWPTILAESEFATAIETDKISLLVQLENQFRAPALPHAIITRFFDNVIAPAIDLRRSSATEILEKAFNCLLGKIPQQQIGLLAPDRIAKRLMGLIEQIERTDLLPDPEQQAQMHDHLARIKDHAKILTDRGQISLDEYTQILSSIERINGRIPLAVDAEADVDTA